jgi:DNA-binding transcriptional MerR regulator
LDKAPDAFRTISEVAEQLDVPQHVLRFWESRFPQIRPMKRGGGRRYYRPEDVDLLRGIRHLLYGEGYTIRGVQRILRDQGVGFVQGVWQAGAEQPSLSPGDDDEAADDIAAVESEAPAKPERSRSLFGALPSLRDRTVESDEVVPERREPTLLPATVSLPAAAPRLAHHQMQKLQQALDELQECRRLIDAALAANH